MNNLKGIEKAPLPRYTAFQSSHCGSPPASTAVVSVQVQIPQES